MADEQQPQEDYYFQDINLRLSDLEGKNNAMKDRTIVLGKNIIKIKEKTDEETSNLKKEISDIKKQLKEINNNISLLLENSKKTVRRDEIALVERMLQDFQPLNFMREKDVLDLMEQKVNKAKKTLTLKKEAKQ
jgi:hypothetical protein